jgi:hypothetical protein
MTRDDIIRMAREAGATPYTNRHYPDRTTHTFGPEQLARFAALVAQEATEEANRRANASWTLMCEKMVATEREACAKLCEDVSQQFHAHAMDCATAIRARSNP